MNNLPQLRTSSTPARSSDRSLRFIGRDMATRAVNSPPRHGALVRHGPWLLRHYYVNGRPDRFVTPGCCQECPERSTPSNLIAVPVGGFIERPIPSVGRIR